MQIKDFWRLKTNEKPLLSIEHRWRRSMSLTEAGRDRGRDIDMKQWHNQAEISLLNAHLSDSINRVQLNGFNSSWTIWLD